MSSTCTCCYHDSAILLLNTEDSSGERVSIHHCTICCALVPQYQRDACDVIEGQAKYHAEHWASDEAEEVLRQSIEMRSVVDFYGERLARFESSVPILDLGGGRGLLTKALLDRGFNALGCDASEPLVRCAQDVLAIPPERYTNEDIASFVTARSEALIGKVGAIFLWHVIEHLEQPLKILTQMRTLLRDDGIIIAQGPLLHREYIFEQHRFLHSESNVGWIADQIGMKVLFLESFSRERFVSFVFGGPYYSEQAIDVVYMSLPQDACGALFNTLSCALHEAVQP